jgi:hypothetical protein
MTDAAEFVQHARRLVVGQLSPPGMEAREIELRRAISSAYYGLFHRLTNAGSMLLAAGGEPLRFQTARAFTHVTMRKVCDAYTRSPACPFPGLSHLYPGAPDPRLINVANAFARLQEGRHAADYDLSLVVKTSYAAELVLIAEAALAEFDTIESFPETTVFLTALLLADRWTRRG